MATSLDRDDVSRIHLCAFPEGEREIVSKLAINLLSEETTPQTISLVAETEGAVVGHVAFSPVTIDNHGNWQGYILAPLGVKPEYQRRGIGSKLINYLNNLCIQNKITLLEVATQVENKQANKFYLKNKFQLKSITNIYHFWTLKW